MGFFKKLHPKNVIKTTKNAFKEGSFKGFLKAGLDPGGMMHDNQSAAHAEAARRAAAAGQGNSGNPFAQFAYQPGIGYGTGANGQNPFEGVMGQIPATFFQNPQAMQYLSQIMGGASAPQRAPAAPLAPMESEMDPNAFAAALTKRPWLGAGVKGTPGPAPTGATRLAQASGLGNGGGQMGLQIQRFMAR